MTRKIFVAFLFFFFAFWMSARTVFAKGTSDDSLMHVDIRSDVMKAIPQIEITTIDAAQLLDSFPKEESAIGQVYQFDLINKEFYDGKKPINVEIAVPSDVPSHRLHGARHISFYNGTKKIWQALPSVEHDETLTVTTKLYLPFARLMIFEDSMPAVGSASWYGYKHCNCAASPDYPKGTRLLVTRVDKPEKSVIVKVNDYGPDRSQFPDRIIDLDKTAYKKLAPLGSGVIDVRVERLKN